jgi:hypothetical protein
VLLIATPVRESRSSINDLPDRYGFYCGFVEDSGGIRFHLGNYGSTDQGSSFYTCQDDLLWTVTSRVVYVKDSLSGRGCMKPWISN